MKKEPYQNKLDKRPIDNKKAKEQSIRPATKDELKNGLASDKCKK